MAAIIQDLQCKQILEFGSGYYSTPLIQALGGESIESDPDWLDSIRQYYPKVHSGATKKVWYDLILVDSSPEAGRRQHVLDNIERCPVFVLHDALPAWEPTFQYDSLRPLFKHIYDYRELCPFTLVLSQVPIKCLESGLSYRQ